MLNIQCNHAVISDIKEAIMSKSPFSLTRIGDGEIAILKRAESEKLKNKIVKLFNVDDDYEIFREKIINIILSGMSGATYLGILTENSPIVSNGHLNYNPTSWIPPTKLLSEKQKYCDHQICRSFELGNISEFSKIINGASVNIISPNTFDLNKLQKLLNCEVRHTRSNNCREDLLNNINDIEEQVVIYGTSIIGKDIGTILSIKGKVCLDFGATLDAWAGIISRKWFEADNVQNYLVVT